jgi:hypothetical protein
MKQIRFVFKGLIKAVVVKLVQYTRLVLEGRGGMVFGLFQRTLPFFKPLLYSGEKAIGKELIERGSNILTDLLNKEPDQQVGQILRARFDVAKDNLEHKVKKMTESGLCLKRKRKLKMLILKVNVGW